MARLPPRVIQKEVPLKSIKDLVGGKWNWVQQDASAMWYDTIYGKLTTVDRGITARCIDIEPRLGQTI
jgi:hypothetical protein